MKLKSIFSDEPEKKLKLTGNKAMEIHLFLDESYEQMLTDSELCSRIFAESSNKNSFQPIPKRFKFHDVRIDENEEQINAFRVENMRDQ